MKTMRSASLGCAVIMLAVASCTANKEYLSSVSEKNYGTPSHILTSYNLVWKDDFNGKYLDQKKWNYRGEGSVRNHATVSRKTVGVDGKGNMVIKVIQEPDGTYLVGQAGTEGIFETRYGYFECRALVNKTLGPHTAFWLQTPDINNTDNNPKKYGAEVDIFEFHMKTPETVHHNIHWNGYAKATHKQASIQIPMPSIKDGYHTFGLEWTKNEYIFYVDGKETWRTTEAVSQRKEFMILSTELTGFGGDPAHGSYPDSILFDYVRVYKKKR